MTSTQPVLLEQRGEFPNKSFKSIAGKMWDKFFELAIPNHDIAHWNVDGYSSTVRLTGREINSNEYSPDWNVTPPIIVIVDGFFESMSPDETVPNAEMLGKFTQWVEAGIVDSFGLKRIEMKYEKGAFDSKSFGIVSSPTDAGLADDELELIWSNDKHLSSSKIRSRQLAAQKGRKFTAGKKKRARR